MISVSAKAVCDNNNFIRKSRRDNKKLGDCEEELDSHTSIECLHSGWSDDSGMSNSHTWSMSWLFYTGLLLESVEHEIGNSSPSKCS